MLLSWNEIRLRAASFVNEWESKAPTAREESDAYDFQTDFLNIFGVSRRQVATFEHRVNIGGQPDLLSILVWKYFTLRHKGTKNTEKFIRLFSLCPPWDSVPLCENYEMKL